MRQPYLIYKKTVRNKKHFYVKVWDETTYDYSIRKSIRAIKDELGPKGSRFPHTSKAGADALVQLWLKETPKEITKDRLDQYLLSFWKEDSDFIKGQALRGKTYSTMYIHNNHSGIDKFFLPFLDVVKKRNILLYQVKPDLLESFLNYMTDKNEVGVKRINDILQAVKVALSEAFRLGKIQENPGAKVKKLQEIKTTREIFTPEEVREFFDINQNDLRYYAINLLAATTGLRLGECRGLLHEDVKEGYVEVRHNWQDGEGLKPPKWDSQRNVPIPSRTHDVLKELVHSNPYGNNFVFWGTKTQEPIAKRAVSDNFNKTVDKMGIQNRKDRGLTFHAWRHFFNSMLRGNVHDHTLRKLTGHSSEAMTERYTAITEDQRKAVSELADKII